jgi:hypothetical protein
VQLSQFSSARSKGISQRTRTLLTVGLLAGLATLGCKLGGTMGDGGMEPPALSCTPGGAPCDGCCSGSTCQKGDTGEQCGFNGGACTQCAPDTYCRSPFAGCTTDPKSRWKVWPFAADVAALNAGASWDPDDGLPDTFLNLYCPSGATTVGAFTAVKNDTLMPRWSSASGDCIVDARTLETAGFEVEAFDDDGPMMPPQTITPRSAVKVNDDDFDRGWMEASGGGLEHVWFKLERQP